MRVKRNSKQKTDKFVAWNRVVFTHSDDVI